MAPKGAPRSDSRSRAHQRPPPSRPPQLPQHVTKPALRDRVAAKFVEAEFEKTDMLVEIMFR